MPDLFPFDIQPETNIEHLMMSASERHPFMFFASSKPHGASQHMSTPEDSILTEEPYIPTPPQTVRPQTVKPTDKKQQIWHRAPHGLQSSRSVSMPSISPTFGFPKPRKSEQQTRSRNHGQRHVHRPNTQTTPRQDSSRKNADRQKVNTGRVHSHQPTRSEAKNSDADIVSIGSHILTQIQNLIKSPINNEQYVVHENSNRKPVPFSAEDIIASLPKTYSEKHSSMDEDQQKGKKFVIFHAPVLVTTERPSSAPYLPTESRSNNNRDALHTTTPPPSFSNNKDPMTTALENPALVIDLVPLSEPTLKALQGAIVRPETNDHRDESSRQTSRANHPDTSYTAGTRQPFPEYFSSHYPGNDEIQNLPFPEIEKPTPPMQFKNDNRASTPKKRLEKKKDATKRTKVASYGFVSGELDSQNVPGKPGSDYPIFHEIPFTNFQCKEYKKPGFYADLEAGCQIFHNCDTGMVKHSFLCPNGTIFHQELFICDWWYNVHCDDSINYYSLNDGLFVEPPKKQKEAEKGKGTGTT